MKHFFKLLLQKARYVLLLRFSPSEATSIKEALGDDDFEKISAIATNKQSNINAKALDALLEGYERVGLSYIPELPLELALIKIIGNNAAA